MKTSELLAKITMHPVTKGRNLRLVGWADGYMLVAFHGSSERWIYGPDVAEVERDKILRVPYPDALFQHNVKARYKAFKVGK